MSLFAHIEMAGNSQGNISEREATGNGPVTVLVGLPNRALEITVLPSGAYTIETTESGGKPAYLSFFAKTSKGTVHFRRKKVTGTLKEGE